MIVNAADMDPLGTFTQPPTHLAGGETYDGYVSLVDGVTGLERRRLDHGPSVEGSPGGRAAAYSPDGSLLVSGATDATVRIWDVATGRELRRLAGLEKPALGVALSPDGETVAAGSFDGSLWL